MSNTQPVTKTLAIIGGDRRQAYMAELLCGHGYTVRVLGITPLCPHSHIQSCSYLEEAITGSDWILCPIPFHKGLGVPMEELLAHLTSQQALAGGCIPAHVLEYCHKHHIRCHDFMKSEPVAIYNTIATAEGAIAEALIRHPSNLHGEHALVLGYGRCAKTLAGKLKGFSAQVTVCARSPVHTALAGALGHHTLDWSLLSQNIGDFQYIFNTIPAMVLDETMIQNIHPTAIIIDIASAPGGVDFKAASSAGIDAGLYLGLPGKYAPLASAKALVTDLISQF